MPENSLQLVGDGDELDFVAQLEGALGFGLPDEEWARVRTFGQLNDLLLERAKSDRSVNKACLAMVAFHRLRSYWRAAGIEVRPATRLSEVGLGPERSPKDIRKTWRLLKSGVGLELPPLRAEPSALMALVLWPLLAKWRLGMVAAGAVILAFALSEAWIVPAIAFGVFLAPACASIVDHVLYATVPKELVTVGDLAHRLAGLNYARLVREKGGSSSRDIWDALLAVAYSVGVPEGVTITRQTTFLAER